MTDNKKVENRNANTELITELLDPSYQGVKRLTVLAYDHTAGNNHVSVDSFKIYFLPILKIEDYNIKIGGGNFYGQPMINDSIKQFNKVRKVSTGPGHDYTTGC